MTIPSNENLVDFREALFKKRATELYAKYDCNNPESNPLVLSAEGVSILSDVEFFLTHDRFGPMFERIFTELLGEFSNLMVEGNIR